MPRVSFLPSGSSCCRYGFLNRQLKPPLSSPRIHDPSQRQYIHIPATNLHDHITNNHPLYVDERSPSPRCLLLETTPRTLPISKTHPDPRHHPKYGVRPHEDSRARPCSCPRGHQRRTSLSNTPSPLLQFWRPVSERIASCLPECIFDRTQTTICERHTPRQYTLERHIQQRIRRYRFRSDALAGLDAAS